MRFKNMTGWWDVGGFPEVIRIAGCRFRQARWQEAAEGVVAQYREDVPVNSRHLKVYANGRWMIDHIDKINPDHGKPVEHFLVDHPLGQFLAAVAVVGGVLAVGAGLVAAFKNA